MATPLLAAALIVRDEEARLPGCLRALDTLRPLLDHVVVHDTGSTDRTRDIAREYGARVVEGHWGDDFARARNTAAAATVARWVLAVDADELVVADRDRLREILLAAGRGDDRPDAFVVPLVNLTADGGEQYAAPLGRLYRPARARFVGRLHERVERRGPGLLRCPGLDRSVLQLRHSGYADPAVVATKVERNLRLAEREVGRELASGGHDGRALVRALYHRGRTLIVAGRLAEGIADLEQVQRTPVTAPERTWALDVLAQALLDAGRVDEVGEVATELRAGGVDPRWCAWLQAQALGAQGRFAEALPLLRTVDELVDSVGRTHDVQQVVEAQLLAAGRTGAVDEAAAACIRLMAGFGRTEGMGRLLLTLWGGRPAEWLVELLGGADRGHRSAVVTELRSCPEPGPRVAEALAALPAPHAPGQVPAQRQPATSTEAPRS